MGTSAGPATLDCAVPDDPDEIPLFPLPQVVLFPLATVPLFVFEPRYRQMMADVLARSARRIGMVAVAEAHLGDMEGNPPVAPLGCEGEVAGVEKNPDGTYRVLLRGTRRIRIVDEQPPDRERLYRVARVETVPDLVDVTDREALHARRTEVLGLLSELVQHTTTAHANAFAPERFDGIDDEQLVNTLAQALDLDPHDKQLLLELDRVRERQHMLCAFMRFRIAELEGGSGQGPATMH